MPKVFISYAHEDKHFLDELVAHTAALRRRKIIEIWTDSDIPTGSKWDPAIWENLETSGIVVLLVTADFLNSDFGMRELDAALRRQNEGKATVVAVIVRVCQWQETELQHFQVLCADTPVYKHGPLKQDRDTAWFHVVEVIKGIAERPAAPKPGDTRINPKDGQPYIWIPPGSFLMGAPDNDTEAYPDERPQHRVTITKGFWMGKTPVTQAAYERVMGSNPSYFKGVNLPVESITWAEADAYAKAVGMRLPTEAEWEYAARAGSTASRYGDLDKIAWFGDNSGSKPLDTAALWSKDPDVGRHLTRLTDNGNTTHPVGTKLPNQWGLHDTLGNVWEWISDWFADYQAGSQTDPQGPSSSDQKVLRGGSWYYLPRFLRASVRSGFDRARRNDDIGARCVGELP
jgi:formylglycine-generating enzyme required for sulfatase activity